MAKIINLKPEEEITSVIERLWETAEEEIFLVAPKGSVLLRNIIGLKLLKREADRLGKEILVITKDEVAREMAKRVGLNSRVTLPKEKKGGSDFDDEVLCEVSPKKFEAFLGEEIAEKRSSSSGHLNMSDIRPKGKLSTEGRLIKADIKTPETEDDFIEEEVEEIEKESDFDALDQELKKDPELPDNFYFTQFQKEPEKEESENTEEVSEGFYLDDKEEELLNKKDKTKIKKFTWPKFPAKFLKNNLPIGEKRIEVKNEDERDNFEIISKKLKLPFFSGKFLFLFISLALAVAAAVLFFVLPKAEIEVAPKSEILSQNLNILVDKGVSKIDYALNKIPAQLIKLEKKYSQNFAATGQRQVNEKAKGIITVFNEFSSSAQSLVEKTRFSSEDGKVFRTTQAITVPGAKIVDGKIVASSIDVAVVADQPGSDYNIGAGRFSIPGFSGSPKYTAFYGRSDKGFSGGASGLMKVVSQEDFDKAKTQFWDESKVMLDKEFRAQIPSGLKSLDFSFKEELASTESSAAIGQPADNFTLTLKGVATVLLFDESDILDIINKKIGEKNGADKGLTVKMEKIDYQLSGLPDFSRGQMNLAAKLDGKIVWPLNAEDIKKAVIGKGEQAMRDYFAQHPEITEVKVSFWPFWVKSVPANLDKIEIIVKE